jgi:putative oxidoreductase
MTPSEATLIAARVVTGAAFVFIGLRNISAREGIAGFIGANRFPAPVFLAYFGIAMQIGFGALMISGFYPLVAALGLLVFTMLATLMAHSFWTFKAEDRPAQTNSFLANMIMTGGLLALAAAAL